VNVNTPRHPAICYRPTLWKGRAGGYLNKTQSSQGGVDALRTGRTCTGFDKRLLGACVH
jgi:hypothetical protein